MGKDSKLDSHLVDKDKLNIVVTQPRRVATISMMKRICQERGLSESGEEVSYSIRFDDRCTPNTKLRYLTDGILVRECISVNHCETDRILC